MLASTVTTMQDNSAHGEDSFLTKDLGDGEFLDVVLDGVTGHGGAQASTELKEALDGGVLNNPEDVVKLLSEMNADFFSVGAGRFLLTTVSAVLGRGDKLQIISAGDSPVFLIKKDGYQKLSGHAGGFLHVGVARAIGASEQLGAPAQVEITPSLGDRILLATDGITDNMTIEELADAVRNAATPEEAAAAIEATIKERLQEGRVPETIGVRFRYDDRTGIIRFF
ncbi:MAG: SpoIIE family protein phosphatase [Chloroflexi bacterium]|nr:SpoIIE family protein phosphatase [Chloroflexota bacterium]